MHETVDSLMVILSTVSAVDRHCDASVAVDTTKFLEHRLNDIPKPCVFLFRLRGLMIAPFIIAGAGHAQYLT